MKQLLFITLLSLLYALDANAQYLKPQGGEKTTEISFSLATPAAIGFNDFRFRYFTDNKTAYRMGLGLSSSSTAFIRTRSNIDLKDVETLFELTMTPGFERHFNIEASQKLSPYFGAEGIFSYSRSSFEDQRLSIFSDGVTTDSGSASAWGFGFNIFLGADWYFSEQIYLGTEIGLGFISSRVSESDSDDYIRLRYFGPELSRSIRFGFVF